MRRRRTAVAAAGVAVAVVVGVVLVGSRGGGGGDGELEVFCREARAEGAALAGSVGERREALARLGDVAPEELAGVVEAAAADVGGVPDVFVVPGDPTSDVDRDAVVEELGRRSSAGQGWDVVVGVLAEDCELEGIGQ